VVVPAYTEEGAIDSVIDQVEKAMASTAMTYEIVVVDDGSTDRTRGVLSQRKGITVVTHAENRGYGAALKSGIRKARGDVIVITDADGSYPNEEVPKLLAELDQSCEMVVGARTGDLVSIPWFRRTAKGMLGALANYLSGRKIPDMNSGFRIFRKEAYLRFSNLISDGFSFTTTLTLAMLCNGYEVKFFPVNYYKRTGTSKIRPVRETLNFLLLIVRVVTYFNPLKIFIPSSIVLLLAGLAYGLYQVISPFHDLGDAPVLLILMGVQLLFLGLLADMIAKRFKA
jgi:glycosyltransferase involved in cell wall biosynthesis